MLLLGESSATQILCDNSITSFGERLNDYETTLNYFRMHFLQVHRKNNENRRVLYTHFTNVVVCGTRLRDSWQLSPCTCLGHQSDATRHRQWWVYDPWLMDTSLTTLLVRDSIFRGYLQSAALVWNWKVRTAISKVRTAISKVILSSCFLITIVLLGKRLPPNLLSYCLMSRVCPIIVL